MSQAAGASLHILTLTPFFPSDRNEVTGCFVSEPVEQLRKCGVACSVIALSPIYAARRRSSSSAPAQWVRYPQIPGTLGLSSAGIFLYLRLLPRLRRLHAAQPISLIHAHAALPTGHVAMLLSRSLKIPFVVTVHGLDVMNTCAQGGAPAAWRRRVSLQVYSAAQTVICISGKVEQMLKIGMQEAARSSVVYNGVDPNVFSPSPLAEAPPHPEILTIGTLVPSKGHELVLRAMSMLRVSFPQLRCRIIGEGPDCNRFQALAGELGIRDLVHFAGRQSREQVAEAMRRCAVFALPSWNEGLGCVYLEAMSCGRPVIGCHGQGIAEVIEHGRNGWLIPSEGLDQLVQALTDFLASTELSQRIGMAARQTILARFTVSHQAQDLAAIYRQAVA